MSPAREAVFLPLVLLTVVLLGGLDPGSVKPWAAASPFALVLAMLLVAALVRSGAIAPERMMNESRTALENANGFVVLACLFAASAQMLHMLIPRSGLPALIVGLVLLLLLVNTLAVEPDRRRMLRSLAVLIGSSFLLKFVVLAALADTAGGRTRRVLIALLDAATLGSIAQAPLHPAAGYLAFFAALLFLVGVAALPVRGGRRDSQAEMQMSTRHELPQKHRDTKHIDGSST
ncbi:MAG TPA: hypothetical protein VKA61_13335 [Sphingomicrobium sp.]|nr:hypothetical protein [Sphingomicrobium sp.]